MAVAAEKEVVLFLVFVLEDVVGGGEVEVGAGEWVAGGEGWPAAAAAAGDDGGSIVGVVLYCSDTVFRECKCHGGTEGKGKKKKRLLQVSVGVSQQKV